MSSWFQFLEPGGELVLHSFESAGEKVIRVLYKNSTPGLAGCFCNSQEGFAGRKSVAVSAEEELGQGAIAQVGIVIAAMIGLDGQAESGNGVNFASLVEIGVTARATGGQCHGCAKAEAYGYDRAMIFVFEPVERGRYVFAF